MNQDYPAICQESLYAAALQKSHLPEFCTAAFCKEVPSTIGKASPIPSSASEGGTMLGNPMADDLFSLEGKLQSSIADSISDTNGFFYTKK